MIGLWGAPRLLFFSRAAQGERQRGSDVPAHVVTGVCEFCVTPLTTHQTRRMCHHKHALSAAKARQTPDAW